MNEMIVKIDDENSLVGVLSAGTESKTAPMVLMFNAGLLHRVGPNRLWVQIARELAAVQIPSFRFDLYGQGDSLLGSSAVENPIYYIAKNIITAMDYVENCLGRRNFILLGLCSGADVSLMMMKQEPRIKGAILIDAYGYRTNRYHLQYILERVASFSHWKSFIKRKICSRKNKPDAAGLAEEIREFPPREEVQSDLISFLNEGRQLYFIYTKGVDNYYNYKKQFWDMFPKIKPQKGLYLDYFSKADHTFTCISEQVNMKGHVIEFVTHFTAP